MDISKTYSKISGNEDFDKKLRISLDSLQNLYNALLQDFLRAFPITKQRSKPKRDKISKALPIMVESWLEGDSDSVACSKGGIHRSLWIRYLGEYDKLMKKNKTLGSTYDISHNPMRILRQECKTFRVKMELEGLYKVAKDKGSVNGVLKIQKKRDELNKDDTLEQIEVPKTKEVAVKQEEEPKKQYKVNINILNTGSEHLKELQVPFTPNNSDEETEKHIEAATALNKLNKED